MVGLTGMGFGLGFWVLFWGVGDSCHLVTEEGLRQPGSPPTVPQKGVDVPPPSQIKLFHFTHVDHVASIARTGLLSDGKEPDLQHEAGDREIKARRRRQIIDASPGGVVADYVPFYFAPRSPMMYSISRGDVPRTIARGAGSRRRFHA